MTAVVTQSAGGTPITGATAVALVPNHPYQGTTGPDGRAALVDTSARNCVPAGGVAVQASADRYQDKSVSVQVPDSGAVEVPIALDCTPVSGNVVNATGSGVPGAVVMLRDANQTLLLDENGNPFLATTAADGSFAFNCVRHGFVQVWTLADPSQVNHTMVIGPPGWTNVTVIIQQPTCGNLVGQVIDADTQAPVSGAIVTESNGQQTTTDAGGGTGSCACGQPGRTPSMRQPPATRPGTPRASSLPSATPRRSSSSSPPPPRWHSRSASPGSHSLRPRLAPVRARPGRRPVPLYFEDLTPVSYVSLAQDVKNGYGPETITIERTPPGAGGQFVAGDYHYWVHDYTGPTFIDSDASVAISAVDGQGKLTQIASYDVTAAAGYQTNATPYEGWHVVDFTLDASGTITRTDVQAFVECAGLQVCYDTVL